MHPPLRKYEKDVGARQRRQWIQFKNVGRPGFIDAEIHAAEIQTADGL
jgi:hypothetical protein